MKKTIGLIALAATLVLLSMRAQADTILHSFGNGDGYLPDYSSLTPSGSTFYSMTYSGGTSEAGTVFTMNADGTDYSVLHSFNIGDGARPTGSLTLDGTTLYGMASNGGYNTYNGTIFSMNTDGSGFSVLHLFTGSITSNLYAPDGGTPYGSLTLSGTTLYGMNGLGNIFKLNADGSAFTTLHALNFDGSEGAAPRGSLTLSNTTLYGTTSSGGANNGGTIFKMNTDGTGFSLLHSFGPQLGPGITPGVDGTYATGDLTLVGSKLYGMTSFGGATNQGTVFEINTDGTGYSVLHSFGSAADDGTIRDDSFGGNLILVGSTLYGETQNGGSNNTGTVFQINLDGTGYETIYSFGPTQAYNDYHSTDGAGPRGTLTYLNGNLYGMTAYGGTYGGGTVFELSGLTPIPEPSTYGAIAGLGLMGLALGNVLLRRRKLAA